MVLELSRQAEQDGIMAARIETKQFAVEEESIAEALAWSYEHGDVSKINYVGRLIDRHKSMGRYDDSTCGSFVADEADFRLLEPCFPRGFSSADDSQEAINMCVSEVVHLPPAQRAFPSRKASMKHGLLGRKWGKHNDPWARKTDSAKSGRLVSKVHSTKSRMNRMFRDWTPTIGPELGRAGSILSELFGRSSDFSVDLADFEYLGAFDPEESVEAPVMKIESMDFSHVSEMTQMPDFEYTEEVVSITDVHSRSREDTMHSIDRMHSRSREDTMHSLDRMYGETLKPPSRQYDDSEYSQSRQYDDTVHSRSRQYDSAYEYSVHLQSRQHDNTERSRSRNYDDTITFSF